MRPIAVRDCNRICRLNNDPRRFTLADRFNKGKCWEMFEILVHNYLGDAATLRDVAMLWRRGAEDMHAPTTKASRHYLRKVRVEQLRRGITERIK